MKYKDYYQTLGVSKDASQDDIKRAYRKLARKYHPDVSKESDAEAQFKEVGEAYEVLKDPEKRAAYDQLGANWKAGQEGFQPPPDWDAGFEFHGGGFTSDQFKSAEFSDFFEQLFGRAYAGHSPGSGTSHQGFHGQGDDSHAKVLIDLEDAYNNTTRSINLRSTVMDNQGRPQIKERTLNVKIPKGVKQGQSIRLKGQGSPGFGSGPAGDLYLEIEFNPHPLYTIEGLDVSLEVPITPWEAALGGTIQIPSPKGKVDLKIPPHSSSGKRLRLKGQGIPAAHPGDFYVKLVIVLPDTLSSKEHQLYESLKQESRHFNPRSQMGAQ